MPKNNKNMENDIEHDGIRQRYSLFYLMRNHKISLVSGESVVLL